MTKSKESLERLKKLYLRDKQSPIAAAKAQLARDGSCTPLKPLRRWPWGGVQATARDPKLNEGDRSLIAQEKKKGGL